jgi:predicted metal-dependent phosphotriesterase family hydrolase
MTDIPVDRLVAAYIKMRDKRSELLRAYEEDDEAIKTQMDMVESKLLDLCKTIGVDSLKTQHGTIIRSVKTRYWTSDWEAMHKFILEHKMPDLLEKRVSQSTMKQLLEENPDIMPKGMNIDSRYAVTIRRSSSAN